MTPWVCRCGSVGEAPSKGQAYTDWLQHAQAERCTSIDPQQLLDLVAAT